ncbi:MAG: proton-conducting transporter membrane subunit [Clostridiaceae bacterium]|nr:proton-conducting transporter membrane subunit [Clostridiaceae bacterium]
MDFIRNFPFFSIMLAMLAAIVTSVLPKKAARLLNSAVVSVCILLNAAVLWYTLYTGASFTYMMGHFPAPWGNELRAGALEALMATVFSGILLFSVIGGAKHIDLDLEERKVNLYYVMINLLEGALLAMLYTNDIFTGYVFIEILTIASCGILMIRQIGRTTLAAVRYMIMSLLGSGLFLIGVVLLYDMTGHLLMENMHTAIAALVESGQYTLPLTIAVGLITMGLCIKCGLFPFHFWMPDTYGYSTPASSAILSGLISKIYIMMLIKVFYRVVGVDIIRASKILNVLFVFGLCAIIVGSISAIRENDIRRMTAFSSAAQIGYIFVGIGLGTTAGMVASLFHIITHAVTKPMLFISASGLSDVSGGSKKFRDLQESGYRNRPAGLAFSVGALSMVGLPLFAGFISKILFATASVQNPRKMLPTLIVLAISTVLNAVYFLRTVIRIYRPAEGETHTERLTVRNQRAFTLSLIVFAALNILLGLWSTPVTDILTAGLAMFS